MLKTINQTVAFLIEIAMLFAFGYYGMNRPWNLLPKLLLTITLLAVVILLWAIFAAPKSERRLQRPYLTIFSLSMFLISAFLLFQSGQSNAGILLATLAIVTQTIGYFTEG